ncbi:helix-turn-helix transcriptional regulator [Leucobacter sp. CSA1]|uniref:Helix-turn-helix transcriptional regulator n=1 Tax=Leucobacter chromiisoli TaxID=2796471 RepID=A0A934Q4E3_9MICO|nr:helix-turn-helix transcriptional regulator [Leucobacter chromiisoli]
MVIGRARVRAGLTIEQLSERSGVSRQTILNLGSGKYHGDLKTWLKLSRALGVGLDELLAPVWEPRE